MVIFDIYGIFPFPKTKRFWIAWRAGKAHMILGVMVFSWSPGFISILHRSIAKHRSYLGRSWLSPRLWTKSFPMAFPLALSISPVQMLRKLWMASTWIWLIYGWRPSCMRMHISCPHSGLERACKNHFWGVKQCHKPPIFLGTVTYHLFMVIWGWIMNYDIVLSTLQQTPRCTGLTFPRTESRVKTPGETPGVAKHWVSSKSHGSRTWSYAVISNRLMFLQYGWLQAPIPARPSHSRIKFISDWHI